MVPEGRRSAFLAVLSSVGVPLLLACSSGPATGPAGPIVAQVTVSPGSADIAVGGTVQLTATVKDADGNVMTEPVSWTSDSPGVARVSTTGLVTGMSVCLATIKASSGTRSGSASITVSAAAGSATASSTLASACG